MYLLKINNKSSIKVWYVLKRFGLSIPSRCLFVSVMGNLPDNCEHLSKSDMHGKTDIMSARQAYCLASGIVQAQHCLTGNPNIQGLLYLLLYLSSPPK